VPLSDLDLEKLDFLSWIFFQKRFCTLSPNAEDQNKQLQQIPRHDKLNHFTYYYSWLAFWETA